MANLGKGSLQQDISCTHDGIMVVKNEQDVTEALEIMKAVRNDDTHVKRGIDNNRLHIGWVPDFLIHKWTKQGYDFDRMSMREICAKMKLEGYEHFLSSDKQLAR